MVESRRRLKIEHGVDDVFQSLRAGDPSVLGHVSNQEGRHLALLGQTLKAGRHLAYLGNAPWRTVQALGIQRLYGVDDQNIRGQLLHPIDHRLLGGFGE